MRKKLLIATTNVGKLNELKSFLSDLAVELVSLKDMGITDDVEETGKTYKENSEKKALFYAKKSNLPSIADDGGFEIDALDGEPGVRSRRWLGHEATDDELINHMIKISKELPKNKRGASFVASVSFALPNGSVWSVDGKIRGIIPENYNLNPIKGYPFRSFFYLPKIGKYYLESELTEEELREYNHRYKAIQKLIPIIQRTFNIE